MAPRFRQRCSVLLNGNGSGRKRGGLLTPGLLGLCSVLAVMAACLLVTLLLQHQFRPAAWAPPIHAADLRLGELDQLRRLEGHEFWATEGIHGSAKRKRAIAGSRTRVTACLCIPCYTPALARD